MDIKESEALAKEVNILLKKTKFLNLELKKVNQVKFNVGRKKLLLRFENNHVRLELKKESAFIEKNSVLVNSRLFDKKGRKTWNGGVVDEDRLWKAVVRILKDNFFPESEGPLEKELKLLPLKLVEQWNKTNLIEKEIDKCSRLFFMANDRELGIEILQNRILLMSGPDMKETFIWTNPVASIWIWKNECWVNKTTNGAGQVERMKVIGSRLLGSFKTNLSRALREAEEQIVALQWDKRRLEEEFAVLLFREDSYNKFDMHSILESSVNWKGVQKERYGRTINSPDEEVFCFIPVEGKEGIMFDKQWNPNIGIERNKPDRFLLPQTLGKIYNMEYNEMKKPSLCCGSERALFVNCEGTEKLPNGDKPSQSYTCLLHPFIDESQALKEKIKWMFSPCIIENSTKKIPINSQLDGIIAFPGKKPGEMSFASVYFKKEADGVQKTFLVPFGLKVPYEEKSIPHYGEGDLKLWNLLECAKVGRKVDYKAKERLRFQLDKARLAYSELLYSNKVRDVLGD